MNEDFCECSEHGYRPATFVCTHLGDAACNDEVVGFNCGESDGPEDLRDAWCDECHKVFVSNGWEWTDESPTPDGLAILCSACYVETRDLADRAGRLRVF